MAMGCQQNRFNSNKNSQPCTEHCPYDRIFLEEDQLKLPGERDCEREVSQDPKYISQAESRDFTASDINVTPYSFSNGPQPHADGKRRPDHTWWFPSMKIKSDAREN